MADRALVLGAGGLVGGLLLRALRARGWEASGTALSSAGRRNLRHLDICAPADVSAALEDLRPAVVLLPAAWTDVDGCERDPRRAHSVNVQGPRNVAQAARTVGSTLVFYSTDYVFDGDAGPYTEDDGPAPINVYGATKLAAERVIEELLPSAHLIVRTTGVYGWDTDSLNFAMQVWRRLSAGESMDVPSDQLGTPTLAPELAEVTVALIEQGLRGVINVAGADLLSRSDFARRLAQGFDLGAGLIRDCTTAEQGRLARRPLVAGLRTAKLEAVSARHALRIDAAVRQLAAAGGSAAAAVATENGVRPSPAAPAISEAPTPHA